ncbi:MAG: Hsp20/alpha crystallin family protein, partial [Blautia sp.]|nr:Hsp20/alpha crystallin family protein [Blautia sp.]
MLMPSIFRENLFDDFFDDFYRPIRREQAPVQQRSAAVMKTDVKETEKGYELSIEFPGYKKEDVQAHLKDGYLTISATT